MNITSKTGPAAPVGKLAPAPEKAGDTAGPVAPAGEHAHTSSLSSISGVSPSENLKAAGGNLNVTGAFQSMELVSREDRDRILNGAAGSRGPMPGLMESIFTPGPAKVTTASPRGLVGRAWDALAGGVKGFFKALGQRFTTPPQSVSSPAQDSGSAARTFELGEKFRIIRADVGPGGLWGRFVEHTEKEFSSENVHALVAAEACLATKDAEGGISRAAFMKMTNFLYDQNATGDLNEQEMVVNLPSSLQDRVKAVRKAFDKAQAAGVVGDVKSEIEKLIQNDTLRRFKCSDVELTRARDRTLGHG